ncbi:hypothetical protein A3D78_04350 [Candidatus Gottesmanbacteria bacterium RIFCSPHIGHO2_02_FULL_39_14]|uniref:SpoVT-AbrB domain-containing protein n=1 Tax=Candidatus Gottesmanbacteria bacterium RIFCSPHIGHO2_02_FULL_39_14 TaxID=1798383 RepID=A0A1F6A302_9BACT|nr:MAG: hypothetical protein A3D78_04350 [Candidatus Gottesmanbacteria bacterium RIFCSPHIGHO2_02_FULL_39_14]
MNGLSTITQKGQVVIPISLRKALKLSPPRRVSFELKGNAIIMKPALSINEAFGMFKTTKRASQADYDKAVEEGVVEKFQKKLSPKNS